MRRKGVREALINRIRSDISSPDFKLDSRALAERLIVVAGPVLFASPGSRINLRCHRSDTTGIDSLSGEGLQWLLNGSARRGPH